MHCEAQATELFPCGLKAAVLKGEARLRPSKICLTPDKIVQMDLKKMLERMCISHHHIVKCVIPFFIIYCT